MKSNFRKYLSLILVFGMCSCEEKYDVYDYPYDSLGFVYEEEFAGIEKSDSVKRMTFVYTDESVRRDTVWVRMQTSGFVTGHDRSFDIEQVKVGGTAVNARAGEHYLPFDDPLVMRHLVVKAGANSAEFPVVLLRDDPYLRQGSVVLKLRLKENDVFKESFPSDRFYTIEFSDQILKPSCWEVFGNNFAGEYGEVKFRFMIDSAVWTFDEEWMSENFGSYNIVDPGYASYLSTFYANRLIEYNRQRMAEGLDVLKEEDGTIVQFNYYGSSDPVPYI